MQQRGHLRLCQIWSAACGHGGGGRLSRVQCPALCLSCSHHPPVTSETSALPAQRTASHSTLLQLEKHSFKKTRVAAVCETGSLGTIANVHTAVENIKWTTPKIFPEPCCERKQKYGSPESDLSSRWGFCKSGGGSKSGGDKSHGARLEGSLMVDGTNLRTTCSAFFRGQSSHIYPTFA